MQTLDMADPRDVVGGSPPLFTGTSSPPSFCLPTEEVGASSPPSETNWSADLSLSPGVEEDLPEQGEFEVVQGSMPSVIRHGKGKSLMKGSRPLQGCLRVERETPTNSGEDTVSDRREGSVGSSDEGGETEEMVVASTSGRPPVAKGRKKPNSVAREGHPRDQYFPRASVIPPNQQVREPGWVLHFWEELIGGGFKSDARLSFDKVGLVPPSLEDRAHDDERGLCVYWKMPKCGFQLALSNFERSLLKVLDITPAQLTAVSWCTIVSFERIFETFSKALGDARPTIPLFGHFFTTAVTSEDYLVIKRRPKRERIFTEKNPRISRIDGWADGWAYIPHPEGVESLEGIRKDWKPMKVGTKTRKHLLPSELSAMERDVAEKLVALVQS